jgi:hypothetical protein
MAAARLSRVHLPVRRARGEGRWPPVQGCALFVRREEGEDSFADGVGQLSCASLAVLVNAIPLFGDEFLDRIAGFEANPTRRRNSERSGNTFFDQCGDGYIVLVEK